MTVYDIPRNALAQCQAQLDLARRGLCSVGGCSTGAVIRPQTQAPRQASASYSTTPTPGVGTGRRHNSAAKLGRGLIDL